MPTTINVSEHKSKEPNRSFNYYITKFFLENTRLTILSFILLVIVGVVSTLSLKTTGFPNPEIGISIIQTVYPGASSETVAKDVTQPLEGAIKGVDGVKTYTSYSSNSFSLISVTMDQNSNYDSVRNKIDSSLKSVALPAGSESPKVTKPEIGGPSLVFSVAGKDLGKIYDTYNKAVNDLNQLPETASITPFVDLKKQAVIKLDLAKMQQLGISVDQVQSTIQSFGQSIPVVSGVPLDNKNYSIVTTVSGSTLDDIKNLKFSPQSNGNSINLNSTALSSFANVDVEYNFVNGDGTKIAIRNDDNSLVSQAVVFNVKAAKNTDLSKYAATISDKFGSYDGVKYLYGKDVKDIPDNKVLLVENFSVNDQNEEQVGEVVSGLVGGQLKFIDGPVSNLGWLLGGIQLVFLVMLAFVSWRAAIIAAISIPLSLVFSVIYLYIIGESLNTLVLFSLVLVIGLVVDPALVILESIQRKVDTGLKGKEAVLEAVKDVGSGLFLATITNIIVFLPFGVISGILGQIFIYIPLTVIPATIGSYIVPLVFLAWLGGLILKPSKNKTQDEEDNLWPVAKWLVNLNYRILNGSRVLRVAIILIGLLIPLALTGFYFSTGQLKSSQFASTDNNNQGSVSGSFLPQTTQEQRDQAVNRIYDILIANKNVKQVFPFGSNSSSSSSDLSLSIQFKDAKDRSEKSLQISKELNKQVQYEFGQNAKEPRFFDVNVGLEQTGPPTANYQVAISVKTDDLNKLQTASVDVGKTLQNVCFTSSRQVEIKDNCDGEKIVDKIDDGYTNKQNKVIEVLLDRQKLQLAQSSIQGAPLSIIINQRLKQLFNINDSKSIYSLKDNDSDIEVVLDKTAPNPTSIDEIKNLSLGTFSGQNVKLSDVAQINEKTPKSSIQRVKGQTIGVVNAGLKEGYTDQATAAQVSTAIATYYQDESKTKALGLEKNSIGEYSEGDTAANNKSFMELLVALVLAIFFTYVVLALFFQSFTQPLVVLYTIPLTFLGMFPALVYLGTGEIGFLEIIGIIILIGIVENVAIFLIDAARQKINNDGWSEKRAISYASGVRLRPVLMTKFTAIASLAPLAVLSQFYRSIALVIMFGLITSGFLSLITTPILFIFFKWLSGQYKNLRWYNKILFFPLFPIYIVYFTIKDKNQPLKKML